jgi:hypothetical protein
MTNAANVSDGARTWLPSSSMGPSAPAARAKKDAVLQARHVDIVDLQLRPIKRGRKRLEPRGFVYLMHLRHIQHELGAIDLREVANDFEDRRLGPVEVQTGNGMQRIAPRWRKKRYDATVGWMSMRAIGDPCSCRGPDRSAR